MGADFGKRGVCVWFLACWCFFFYLDTCAVLLADFFFFG